MKDRAAARWRRVVLVCGKCSKRARGGFGTDRDLPLAKALRRHWGLEKGRKAAAGVLEVRCLGVCPRRGVVTLDASRPGDWLIAAPGEAVAAVAARLDAPAR